jgi:hypothetical protein
MQPDRNPNETDEALDEAEEESFPASDPQSSWGGADSVVDDAENAPAKPGQ